MPYAMAISSPGGSEQFHRIEIDPGQPGPGEVVVRHTAVGLNFVDVYFRTGLYPWSVESDLIAGAEAAGVVEAVGEGVEFEVGQRVAYAVSGGAYASHRKIEASKLVPVPDGVSDEVAAAVILKGLTVSYLIHHSYPVDPGETVLFHAAAGGVGQIAGQWLAAKGARAIGTAGGPEKCELAKACGYAEVIDYRACDFVAETQRLTGGAGVPVVFDSVGKATLKRSLELLQPFGTMVSFGQSSGPADDFVITDLSRASLRLTRPTLFHHIARAGWLRESAAELFGLVADETIRVSIGRSLPLADVAAAHDALEARQTTGSTVLVP